MVLRQHGFFDGIRELTFSYACRNLFPGGFGVCGEEKRASRQV